MLSVPIVPVQADSVPLDTTLTDSLLPQCQCCNEVLLACSQMTWIDTLSIIASIVTIVGFCFTIYEVWGLRGQLKNVHTKIDGAIVRERKRNLNNEQRDILQSVTNMIDHANLCISGGKYKSAYGWFAKIKSGLSEYKSFQHKLDGLLEAESTLVSDMSKLAAHNPLLSLFSKPDYTYIINDLTDLNTILSSEIRRLKDE